MAEQPRRNGKTPDDYAPVDDQWKPRSRAAKLKPFGVRITYTSMFGGRRLSWCQWYETKRARANAMKTFGRSYFWRKDQVYEEIER